VTQSFCPPRQVEMTQILLHDGWHGHAERGRKILGCHRLLLCRVGQKANQASSQVLRVPRLIKINRQLFTVRHLAEVRQVGTHNWNAVSASEMCNAATTRRRGVRHDRDGRPLEHIRQSILLHVAGELNIGLADALLLDRLHVTSGLGMVPAADDQPGIGQDFCDQLKCINHQLKPFVGSPLAKGQNTVLGIAAPRKIRGFGFSSQNAVRAQMHIVAPIFFVEDLTIAGHEHGH
jgi:hypothetical protein